MTISVIDVQKMDYFPTHCPKICLHPLNQNLLSSILMNLDTQICLDSADLWGGTRAEESKVEEAISVYKLVWTITSSVGVKTQQWLSDNYEGVEQTRTSYCPVSDRYSQF